MKTLAIALASLSFIIAAPAVAHATVTLPPGVVQTGPTSFAAQPQLCSCVSAIDGYTFAGLPYSPFVRDQFLKLPASTPVATDVWFALRADPSYQPGTPITSISTTSTVSGTVDPPASDTDTTDTADSYGTG